MSIYQIMLLAIVQGASELLPVSSSAHVIAAEKWMGLDPTTPELTFLLIMLHTGTMVAVILYFWSRWKRWIAPSKSLWPFFQNLGLATLLTGVVGLGLKVLIEHTLLKGKPHAEIELLFGNIPMISAALFVTGLLIHWSGTMENQSGSKTLSSLDSILIGISQGICLPFRGLSRSGTTISTGMWMGVDKMVSEEFSFALAVILTPAVLVREFLRLLRDHKTVGFRADLHMILPGLLGMTLSFVAGLMALRLLSSWIENGRWKYFAYYCFVASGLLWFLK